MTRIPPRVVPGDSASWRTKPGIRLAVTCREQYQKPCRGFFLHPGHMDYRSRPGCFSSVTTGFPQHPPLTRQTNYGPIGPVLVPWKYMGKSRADSLATAVLKAIALFGEMSWNSRFEQRLFLLMGPENWRARDQALRRKQLRQSAQRLRDRCLISERRQADRVTFAVTKRGKAEYYCLKAAEALPCPEGEVTLATFDIAESERQTRKRIRKVLVKAGFKRFQKSVWFSKQACASDIKKCFAAFGLGERVSIFVAKEEKHT